MTDAITAAARVTQAGRSQVPPVRGRRPTWPWLMLAPAAGFVLAFNYWPLARTVWLSLHTTDLFGRTGEFTGADNFTEMLSSGAFWHSMLVTLAFTAGSVGTKLVLGLLIAVPLASRARGTVLARAVVLVPMAVSVAVAGLVFRTLFQPGFGLVDQALASVGVPSPGWLTNPDTALTTVIIVDGWAGLGFTVLILLAALGAVPDEVVEAARLDGAGPIRRTWSVLLPLISPSVFFLMIVQTVDAIREFTVINVVTGGGPADATRTLVMDVWLRAFGPAGGDYGPASARALVLLLLVGVITAIQFGVVEKRVHYR